jgi:hypothetical protein
VRAFGVLEVQVQPASGGVDREGVRRERLADVLGQHGEHVGSVVHAGQCPPLRWWLVFLRHVEVDHDQI